MQSRITADKVDGNVVSVSADCHAILTRSRCNTGSSGLHGDDIGAVSLRLGGSRKESRKPQRLDYRFVNDFALEMDLDHFGIRQCQCCLEFIIVVSLGHFQVSALHLHGTAALRSPGSIEIRSVSTGRLRESIGFRHKEILVSRKIGVERSLSTFKLDGKRTQSALEFFLTLSRNRRELKVLRYRIHTCQRINSTFIASESSQTCKC